MRRKIKGFGHHHLMVPMDDPISAAQYILRKTGAAHLGWRFAQQIAVHFGIPDTEWFWQQQMGCIVYTYCRPYHVEIPPMKEGG